jgi:hypothetical protein
MDTDRQLMGMVCIGDKCFRVLSHSSTTYEKKLNALLNLFYKAPYCNKTVIITACVKLANESNE